jgi:hypothetical protein
MNEIICPNCHVPFKVDETGFAEILKQVRDGQFEEELNARLKLADQAKESQLKLAEANAKTVLQETLSKKDQELAEVKAQLEKADLEKQLSVREAVSKVEKERDELANSIKGKDLEKQLLEKSLKEQFTIELNAKNEVIKFKDEEIALRKDMKSKLSTKMLGESLEQHCEIEFNKLRATAFPKAYFEKDNDATSGTKGDYIYKEMDDAGNEIISIMFEMKNEGDETEKKKKNEDFLTKLDKDRLEKKCEYAVLVSVLESDNELYNTGIIDMSHRFEKMYVVRPQFFIPIITLLRNAAMNTLQYKSQLALVKNQNIDITNFETDLNEFKGQFSKNTDLARRRFEEAIASIDKSIAHLEATKKSLLSSDDNLRLANSKLEGLNIKKLTKNNPTMKAKFDNLDTPSND